jgi:transcriptional regulator with XRE-family HTH domain
MSEPEISIADVLESIERNLVVLKTLLTPPTHTRENNPVEEIDSIATQITAWRLAFDWTQDELASQMGTAQPVISRFEDPAYMGYSLRSLERLAAVFGAKLIIRLAPHPLGVSGWQAMDTAPKDGRAVLLLSASHERMGPDGVVPLSPRVAIGHWDPSGDAWVDEMGRLDGETYALAITGVWFSGGGWFQPNEVTHWRNLPNPPSDGDHHGS